jgi:serine/threonine protein kinase
MTSTLTVQPVTQPAPVNPAVRTITVNGITYNLYANLGSGGQATVVRGEAAGGELVAVKVFFAHTVNAAAHELYFLQALQSHENIVKCLGAAQIAGPLPGTLSASGIVMDLAEGGDFMGYLLDEDGLNINENGPLDPAAARFYFLQMVEGLKHAHARGIVVCDLKPDNMLLLDESCRQLQLADFGHASHRAEVPARPTGTTSYEAPEQRFAAVKPATADKMDVWSLGLCLCILVLGFNPLQKNEEDETYWERLREANEPPERMHVRALRKVREAQADGLGGVRAACAGYGLEARVDSLPAELGALLEGMLQYEVARRLTLEQVVAGSGPWTAPPAAPAVAQPPTAPPAALPTAAYEGSRTQLRSGPSPDRQRSHHDRDAPQAAYRSMAAASDEAEAPMDRSLGALGAEPPRYNSCSALGASSGAHYRSAADMELPPPAPLVFAAPKLKRENAGQ